MHAGSQPPQATQGVAGAPEGGATTEAHASAARVAASPIAAAVRPLWRSGVGATEPGAPVRVDVVETLATLLDLTGSMALASHLDAPSLPQVAAGAPHVAAGAPQVAAGAPHVAAGAPDVAAVAPGAARILPAPAVDLRAWVDERLGPLQTVVERRLADLPGGRSAIWAPERMAQEVATRGLAGARPSRRVTALAREATDACALALRGLLERIRGEARGIRVELGPRLAALGPEAARLEALDALVARARAAATNRLVGRLPGAWVEDFATRLGAALRACTAEDVAAAARGWYGADGFVTAFYADASRSVRAVLEHERTALRELVAAAEALERA